jgi:SAM-dependent methyltransferase
MLPCGVPRVKTPHTLAQLEALSARTIAYYDASAESFREGTKDHDVSQNYAALLSAIHTDPPFALLDIGCGPGRDLAYFKSQGHAPVGVDGSEAFVAMAREATGCEVLHQDFLRLSLPASRFDGVFANASLFHVPTQELPRVLSELFDCLRPGGVFFASNPRGQDSEDSASPRYGAFYSLEKWRVYVVAAGFEELSHYYRPEGKPRSQQPWLATVWRKPEGHASSPKRTTSEGPKLNG